MSTQTMHDKSTHDEGSSLQRFFGAPQVFLPAAIIILAFVVVAVAVPKKLGDALSDLSGGVIGNLGWYYVLLVSAFIFFAIWLAISPIGRIVLGDDQEEPEFGLMSWFAMLFAAGMGIGLVFWGVAEPLTHFASPPPGTPEGQAAAARAAMDTTFLHWGLHAWGIYVVVGLALAYSVHRKGNPISIRWALEPILGKKVKGVLGDIIDVIAIVGTLFGVATSLGFGVSQVSAGLETVGIVDDSTTPLKIILIGAITTVAVISVVTGVDKGIKWLSNLNMGLAMIFLLFILIVGPTIFLLNEFVQQLGSYARNFFSLGFRTLSFEGEEGTNFISGWTTFYWGWWMSWAPFVGVFIARISRGRTVRQFVAGVLLVPTLVTFLWFSVLGGTALYREIFGGGGLIVEGEVSTTSALFDMLQGLPLASVASIVVMILIIVFFVTSSDSGSFVIDMLASGGDQNPPVWSRVFWAVLEGAVAASLLVAGTRAAAGDPLSALQTMSIILALPFSFVMIGMMVAMAKALTQESERLEKAERHLLADEIAGRIMRRETAKKKADASNGTSSSSDSTPST